MLNVRTERSERVNCIIVEGEIDMYVAPELRDVLLSACKKGDAGLAVDLSGVPYMDSSGIATLIECLQCTKKEGMRFVLAGLQENVLGTLRLAKLDGFFEIHATKTDALASFRK